MQIERDVFEYADLPNNLVDRLVLASEAVKRYRVAIFGSRFRLTEVQYRLMTHLASKGSLSLCDLARLVNRDGAQISRTVRALVEAGLVHCARRPRSTAKMIALSAKGRAIHGEMTRVGADWESEIETLMSDEEIAAAMSAMDRLYEAAVRVFKRERNARQTPLSLVARSTGPLSLHATSVVCQPPSTRMVSGATEP